MEEEFPGVGSQIVVYRRKFNRKTRKFGEVDDIPVYARDVLEYYKREDNASKAESIVVKDMKLSVAEKQTKSSDKILRLQMIITPWRTLLI